MKRLHDASFAALLASLALVALVGCTRDEHGHADHDHADHDHADHDDHDHAAHGDEDHDHDHEGHLEVTPEVCENLGVRFAPVEARVVRSLLRAPGALELLPEGRREVHVALDGRVRLNVRQYQRVRAGDVLLELVSPAWRTAQHEVVEAEGQIQVAQAELAVAGARVEEARASVALLEDRLAALEAADVRDADLENRRATVATTVPRLEAEELAARVRLDEAHEHLASLTRTLAALSGRTVEDLLAPIEGEDGRPTARYRTIDDLPLVAEADGVVEHLAVSEGGWLHAGDLALALVDPDRVRFRGTAPASEASALREGARVTVVPPRGPGGEAATAAHGTLSLAPLADPRSRTVTVLVELEAADRPAWARAGVAAYAELLLGGADEPVPAIPDSALVRDGLRTYFFAREADDPDHVVEVDAHLGASDGWWHEVEEVALGTEVAVEGAYALKLASGAGNQAPEGFHFHADGSMHADDEQE